MSVTLWSERLQEYDIFHGILLPSWMFGLKPGFYVAVLLALFHTFTFVADLCKYFNLASSFRCINKSYFIFSMCE